MNCIPELFGLCMYTLRATGGLEEEGKEKRKDLLGGLGFFWETYLRNDTYLTGIEGGGKGA